MSGPVASIHTASGDLASGRISPESPEALSGRLDNFRSLFALASVLTVSALGLLSVCWLPLHDPVDVVGVSLWSGSYTERHEQIAFYVFLLTALASAPVLRWCWKFCPQGLANFSGRALAWLALLGLATRIRWDLSLILMLGAAGWLASRVLQKCASRRRLLWLMTAGVWAVSAEAAVMVFDIPLRAYLIPLSLLILTAVTLHSLAAGELLRKSPAFWLATGGFALASQVTSSATRPELQLLCVLLFLAGGHASIRTAIQHAMRTAPWITAAVVLVLGHRLTSPAVMLNDYVWSVLTAGLIGWTLMLARKQEADFAHHPHAPANFLTVYPLLLLALFLNHLHTFSWWAGGVLVMTVFGLVRTRRWWKPRTTTGWLLAGVFLIIGLPHLDWQRPVDTFHDGQIISAVYEFEQGRTLYTEVFPLRAMEFFVAWLSRMVFPPTLEAAKFGLQFAPPLQMAGGCLIAFAWTRSPLWSLLTGLALCPWLGSYFNSLREGSLIFLLGVAAELLRSPRPRTWFLLAPLGSLTFFCGYDMWTAFVPPVTAAILLAPGRHSGPLRCPQRLAGPLLAGGYACLTLGLFAISLAAWQGPAAVFAYFEIFFDFSRHYIVFYGLPQHSLTPALKTALVFILAGLGTFAATGIWNWKRMPQARRRMWLVLLLASCMFCHRGLGRSGFGHISSVLPCLLAVYSLLCFDAARSLLRNSTSTIRVQFALATLIIMVFLPFRGSIQPATPWEFMNEVAAAPLADPPELQPEPAIQTLVAPGEYLWPGEYGIANYVNRRPNPTRHAIAFCIGSPAEQIQAVRDFQQHRTPLIIWDWGSFDSIPGLLRYYILSPYVLRNYRPLVDQQIPGKFPWAVLAEPDWEGLKDIPEGFNRPIDMRQIPATWGQERWPRLQHSCLAQLPVNNWRSTGASPAAGKANRWTADVQINPRKFNYLLLEFDTVPEHQPASLPVEFTLEFGQDELEADSRITFRGASDQRGFRPRLLIPVGCHPGWTWRSEIRQLHLTSSGEIHLVRPHALVCEIDESGGATAAGSAAAAGH